MSPWVCFSVFSQVVGLLLLSSWILTLNPLADIWLANILFLFIVSSRCRGFPQWGESAVLKEHFQHLLAHETLAKTPHYQSLHKFMTLNFDEVFCFLFVCFLFLF